MAGFVLRHGSPSDHWAWPSATSTTSRPCRSRNVGSWGTTRRWPIPGRQPHLVKLALIGRVVREEPAADALQLPTPSSRFSHGRMVFVPCCAGCGGLRLN